MSEATVCRTVKKVENALLQDKRFHVPGKKALHDGSLDLTVIVVDASEQRVERPQKTAPQLLRQEKVSHPERTNRDRSDLAKDSVRRGQCRSNP